MSEELTDFEKDLKKGLYSAGQVQRMKDNLERELSESDNSEKSVLKFYTDVDLKNETSDISFGECEGRTELKRYVLNTTDATAKNFAFSQVEGVSVQCPSEIKPHKVGLFRFVWTPTKRRGLREDVEFSYSIVYEA